MFTLKNHRQTFKSLLICLACLAVATSLVGCSNVSYDTKENTDVQTTVAPTADATAAPSTEIEVMGNHVIM